jgi:drug/metabolite transporter (DMT)-like permease
MGSSGVKGTMNEPNPNRPGPHPRTLVLLAFAVIYIVWGSTYLAIRVVVETMPPFLSAAARFLVAGGLFVGFLAWRGLPLPTRAEWKLAAVTGLLLCVGGNGLVVWAEKSISSGLAALLVALTPVWFASLEWIRPGGKRPDFKTVVGIVIGFVGVILLVKGRSAADSNGGSLWAALAVVAAGISWAAGSLYSKHAGKAGSPWMNAAAQMICGGVGLLVLSAAVGEPVRTDWSAISGRSVVALVYLVVFGSWLGFSTYVWLLRASTPSLVSTYAYVNPVIAVFLGWLILGETVSGKMFAGALVVVAGVVAITVPRTIVADLLNKFGSRRSTSSKLAERPGFVTCPDRE